MTPRWWTRLPVWSHQTSLALLKISKGDDWKLIEYYQCGTTRHECSEIQLLGDTLIPRGVSQL